MLRVIFPVLMLAAIIIVGCGGHGGALVPAPSATPSLAPAQEATTVPLSTTASEQVDLGGVSSGGTTVISSIALTLPAASTAGTATITVTATAPPGLAAPSARSVHLEHPSMLGVPSTALAYIQVKVNPTITWSQIPTFAFTFPSAVSGNCYIVFYDPTNPAQGWQGVAGPDSCGTSVVISAIKRAVTLNAGTAYTYALVTTASTIATSSTPLPAYCTAEGVSPSNGMTVNITDNSGLLDGNKNPAVLILYVQQQATAAPSPYPNGSWMDSSGNFAEAGALPQPLDAACYSSTQGSRAHNNPLVVPFGHQGRIYLVYATPAPSGQIPNPFSSLAAGQQPKNSFPALFDKLEYGVFSTAVTGPKLGSAGIDITQVDFVGLPLEMQVLASTSATPLPAVAPVSCPPNPVPTASPFAGAPGLGTVFGYTECGYLGLFQTLTTDPTFGSTYGKLVTSQAWSTGASSAPFRALSPAGAITLGNTPFNYNAFGDPSVPIPPLECTDSPAWKAYGIIGCLLDTYAKTPQFYDTKRISGGGSDYDHFCIGADNTKNFVFEATDIGTATSCTNPVPKPTSAAYLPVNPFSIPAVLFTNPSIAFPNPGGQPQTGSTPNPLNCNLSTVGQVFNSSIGLPSVVQPPANSGIPFPIVTPTPTTPPVPPLMFETADAFTLWKGIILELNYGSAFASGNHPLESTPPSFAAGVFKSTISNFYARTAHAYADGQYAYALGYDDGFQWESSATLVAPGTVNLRVNPMPTAPAAFPAGGAVPLPTCGAFQAGVGAWHVP